jgi:integrase
MKTEDWRKKKRSTEGSIKTVNGYMYARIQWIDETTGKRKEKLRRAKNRTEARKYIKEMVSELENHGEEILNADKMTFKELAAKYEQTKLIPAVFQNGIKVLGKRSILPQKSALKPLIEYFGRKAIRTLKPSNLEAYKTDRLNTPVEIAVNVKTEEKDTVTGKTKTILKKETISRQRKMATINRELALLRAMLNFAIREGWILQSPFQRTKGIISNASEVERDRVLSHDEERRLLASCGERTITYTRNGKQITAIDKGGSRKHLKPLIVTALDTAMRRGELFKLKWKDIDLITGTITVQATNAKTEKARIIGMTTRIKTELQELWEISLKDKETLVFGITDTIKNGWKILCDVAGIEDLRFHDLRHTCITRLIRAGVPHSEAMKISGHQEMKTFQRYMNLNNESITNSASMLDIYISQQQENFDNIQLSETVN